MKVEGIYFLLIVGLIIVLGFKQADLDRLKLEIKELKQDQSWSSSQLNVCLGQVKAYDKAFDYHIVLSELGLYPAIKEELYLNEKEKGGK